MLALVVDDFVSPNLGKQRVVHDLHKPMRPTMKNVTAA